MRVLEPSLLVPRDLLEKPSCRLPPSLLAGPHTTSSWVPALDLEAGEGQPCPCL